MAIKVRRNLLRKIGGLLKFEQLHLGDMEPGLAQLLAVLALSPNEITDLKGIRFEITRDNLDYCKAALLVTEGGQQFALRSYFRGPNPDKTEIIGNERSQQSIEDVRKFLDALSIPPDRILWTIADGLKKREYGEGGEVVTCEFGCSTNDNES